jgi:hypothetical protein
MLLALERCALRMAELGEANHAKALHLDHVHLYRRAQLHLRQVASEEASRGVSLGSTRPPALTVEPPSEVIPRLKSVRER